jgi:hypothetical protein
MGECGLNSPGSGQESAFENGNELLGSIKILGIS